MIHVDGDSCPVKDIIVKIARINSIELSFYIDTSHELYPSYGNVITCDKANDSVDYVILGRISKGQILITDDYGLASLALSKGAFVLGSKGREYTQSNIDALLNERYISAKLRKAGLSKSKHKKRSKEDDLAFEARLIEIVSKILNLG